MLFARSLSNLAFSWISEVGPLVSDMTFDKGRVPHGCVPDDGGRGEIGNHLSLAWVTVVGAVTAVVEAARAVAVEAEVQ